jgi:hypothetical protein
MIHSNASATRSPPGRRWYVIAAIIAILGWTAMVVFLVSRLSDLTGGMVRAVVPGQVDVVLKEPGTYTIFHEYESTLDGRVYHVGDVSGLNIRVRSQTGGQNIPLRSATGGRYRAMSNAGRSLFDFNVEAPGAYQIVASYDGGRKEPQTVLAIGHGFAAGLVMTTVGALAMAFASMGAAIAIAVVVFIKRRRARLAGST